MRTGAIFARGSCRALRWMALAGMVFALGGAQAAAQITLVEDPTSFTEGTATTIDFEFEGLVQAATTSVTAVTFTVTTVGDDATLSNNGVVQFTLPANPGTDPEPFEETGSISITPDEDDDAQDGMLTVSFLLTTSGGGGKMLRDSADSSNLGPPSALSPLTVTDDETQGYVLQLLTRLANQEEEKQIEYRIEADPPLVSGMETVELGLSEAYMITGPGTDVVAGSNTTPGEAEVQFTPSDVTRTIYFTAPEDDDSDNQMVTLTAYWGTGSERGQISDTVTLTDPDEPDEPDAGDLTFTGTQAPISVAASVALAVQLPTASGGTAPYTYTATGLPAWLTFTAATRMLTGTPTTAAAAAAVTYTATDSAGVTGSLTFTITVTAAGTPPLVPTGTPSARRLSSVTVGQLREGGQAQATVVLTGPVEPRRIFKARLRLVGQMHTRQSGIGVGTLASQPSRVVGGVRVPLTGELTNADYDADVIGEVTIQPGYSSGSVTIYTGTDPDAEDERLLLQAIKDGQTFTPSSDALPTGGKEKVFMVEDSHTQGYVLTSVPSKIYESGDFTTVSTLHFTPNYVRDDVPVFVTLTASNPAYSALFTNNLPTMQLPLGGQGVQAWFQLVPERRNPPTPRACECDGNREDDEVVVTATVGTDITATLGGEVVAETTVHVVDVHKLPEITVTAMTEDGAGPLMELAEGSKYKVRVEANRNQPSGEVTSETVTVSLALGDDSEAVAEDYRITPSSVSIVGGLNDQSKTFTLEVLAGDGDIGDEMLMLDAMVKGGATNGAVTEEKGMLSVTLMDTTTLNVEPRSDVEVQLAVATAKNVADGPDDLWTYGDDDLSIKLGELFKLPADGFTTTADAMSADAKVVTAEADDGVVTVTAMGMGTTTVTVTATTAASAAQISPNIATVEFEIEVDELTLVLMFEGDMDMMNLVEGGEGAMVTVTANQMVAEDTMVMIMRDRSMSDADDADFTVEPMELMISAGEMEVTATVKAVEDDMAEEMEALVLYAMAGDIQAMGEVKFYLWDEAVPALPIIAQLLLAGLLGIGGFRRYRRR